MSTRPDDEQDDIQEPIMNDETEPNPEEHNPEAPNPEASRPEASGEDPADSGASSDGEILRSVGAGSGEDGDGGPTTELEELRKLYDQALRNLADRDNTIRRMRRDLPLQLAQREEHVLKKLLEVVDNVDRAMDSLEKAQDLERIKEGNRLIDDLFKQFLAGYSIQAMDSAGKPFDPNWHEAVGQAPTHEVPENHVLHVVQPGYLRKARNPESGTTEDKVLRYARVIVSMPAPQAAEAEEAAAQRDSDSDHEDDPGSDPR